MSDRYLWDGSGPSDPLIARLESALRSKRERVASAAERCLPAELRAAATRPHLVRTVGLACLALAAATVIVVSFLRGVAPTPTDDGQALDPPIAIDSPAEDDTTRETGVTAIDGSDSSDQGRNASTPSTTR